MSESPAGHYAGPRRLSRRGLAALLSAAVLATCTSDRSPAGPGVGGRGYLSIRPVLASPANLAAFGFAIDSVRVAAIRPATDTVVDTTVFFDPNSATLRLALSVPLNSSPETFFLLLQLRAGTQVLYSGVDTTQVSVGAPDTSSSATVTLKYVGPGAGLTSISIAPRDSVVTLLGTKQFRVSADSNGKAINSFFVSWSTSDTLTAPIDSTGLLHAPAARAGVFVRAVTPDGVHDSTRVTFIPVPTAVAAFSGGGQTGAVTTRLPLPLRVQVTAADLLGVKGIPVRFQALAGGGSVRDSVVITDGLGFAEDSVSLGTLAGVATFQASVAGLTPAAFTTTATAGAISAAQSVVTVSAPTLASGAAAALTLQAKDAFGNNLTGGGAIVVFTASGGTSTGAIGSTTDHGDGSYTASFTGLLAGSATTIRATINGIAVTTSLPTITVTAGTISPLTSTVTTSSGTVSSGATATLTLQGKDAGGNVVTTGGAVVAFSRSGGTSSGTISPPIDQRDGTYTAVFTGDTAGTATTIHATIGGVAVTSTTTITVVPGNTVAAKSVISVSKDTVASGTTATLTLQAKDTAGNNITTGGLNVVFSHAGGTSGGQIGAPTDNNNGTYTATFTGDTAGTATTIHATIGGEQVTSTLPTITVIPGAVSTARSVVTSSDSVTTTGGVITLTLQAKDAVGNALTKGGATVVFTQGAGTSSGNIQPNPATDNNNGTYTATFTGANSGTPTTIGATIGGTAVTSTPLPTIRVIALVHSADITASETWAAGTHTVTAYIRVRSGATLAIANGATVKFDPGAGLQIGDTTLGESGRLVMDGTQPGTAPGITLTANGTGVPGFWRGIEVQRNLALTTWRRALIEWAGGTRAPFGSVAAEACVLFVNRSGAEVDLDSVRIRQCNHAGIHHFGGASHVHGSVIDTVSGSGIHADFGAQLELDSAVIRGAQKYGLEIPSAAVRLGPSSANQFFGNAVLAVTLQSAQLPGVLRQDTLGGNGANIIDVTAGAPLDSSFTLFRQPRGLVTGVDFDYRITGLLRVSGASGPTVTLDSNAVVRFLGQSGLVIGDSTGTGTGLISSLGSGRANAPTLTSIDVPGSPGEWLGVEIGRLAAAVTLQNVHIEFAGDSLPGRTVRRLGLWIRSPVGPFVLDGAEITGNGATASPKNSAGIGITGTGGAEIRNSKLFQNVGFGIALQDKGFAIVNDTIQNHAIGIAAFLQGGHQLSAADVIEGNTFPGTQYAVSLTAGALRALVPNAFGTAASDTVLLDGGLLTVDATLPNLGGPVWRATRTTTIDSGATFTVAPGDTVAFDSSAGIQVGGLAPAALVADGTAGTILFTASGPPPQGWHGIDFHMMSGSGSTTSSTFRHVDLDRAGFEEACPARLECSAISFGALRFTDSLTPTNVDLGVTNLIVRRSNAIALDFQRGGTGTVSITASQFYLNERNPMIRTRFGQGGHLSITGSDLYHYRDSVIQSAFAGGPQDSINLVNNWWGDVLGPDTGSQSLDSLGRASTNGEAAHVAPFATAPVFPVGAAVGVVTTRDSLLNPVNLDDSIGIYARVVDVNGRGVPGTVSWTPLPVGASTIAPSSSPSDIGGRVNAGWKFTNTAGRLTAHATGGGGFTDYFIDVQPGLTNGTFAWSLDPARSQGTVTGARAITFTSTNRTGVVVTHTHDAFNNATHPTSICFADLNGACSFFPAYGAVDSTHSDGVDGDTIFFHTSVTQPTTFVLRALYTLVTGGQQADSIQITMASIPVGVRIDRDEFTPGVQVAPDTLVLNGICPVGQSNFFCQREVLAVVVDSGNAPVANQDAVFQWTLVPAAGAPVSLATRGTPGNDSATVTALANGIVRLIATDTTTNDFGADTLPILVQQTISHVLVSPDTVSVLVGGTATFTAAAIDAAGDTVTAAQIHWRPYNPFNPHITITDTATANQATVRLDSTPVGQEYVTAFTVIAPGDTAYGFGQVSNPVLKQMPAGLEPWAIAANTQSHTVYVGHQFGPIYKIDGSTDAVVDSVAPGLTVGALAVNSVTNRLFAATNQGVAVLDGTTLSTVTTVATGTNSQGVTNLQGLTVDSVGNRIWVTVAPPGAAPQRLLRQIDGATNTFSTGNDVSLPDTGAGAAFNPANGRIYVAIPDSNLVVVVDPGTHAVTQRISVGSTPTFVAVNPATNRVYVINQSSTDLSVIDAATGTVVSTVPLYYFVGSVAVDVVHNRIYVGVVNLPSLLVVNGATNFFENILPVGTAGVSEAVRGVVVDGAVGNGKIFTANYSTGTVSRLQF